MSKQSRRASRRNRGNPDDRIAERVAAGVPHGRPKYGSLGQRLPMNMAEVRNLLSKRTDAKHLRMPIGRREGRYWNNLWRYKGRGFTKPFFKGDSKKRKLRAKKQSRKRAERRLNNNRPKAKKVR